ncbi:Tetraspanin-32 [Apodemus speciosus]|uniref:Tetraspanin n=1 Tax=Apodemus speciosus TaxID=105296 RepID=A0ABQ0FRP9_APOSI
MCPVLLGLSVATVAVITHFGDHFTVIGRASLERNPYETLRYWAFYVGISLAGLLGLGAALSTTATVREAHGLMAAGFLCFALSFCILVQVAFWRFHNPTQVEDAVLDTYDLVYDQAMKSPSSSWWQELAVIQDTFLCCGKKSPFGLLASTGAIMCQGQEAMREVRRGTTASGLRSGVYAMMLCAFLWFAIHSYCGLDRKGRYSLTPRYPMAASPRNPTSSDGPRMDWYLNAPLKRTRLLTIQQPSEA